MKKYLLFLAYFSFIHQVTAQHIADPDFARGIRYQCFTCIDTASNLTEDARKQTNLSISILGIRDLAGIEGFSSLRSLNCTNNNLTALPDKLPSQLIYINISHNKIALLKNIPVGVKDFSCADNGLTALPALPASLIRLDCSYNKIAVLPPLSNLIELVCGNNKLTVLPTLPNQLQGLLCAYNELTALPMLPQTLIRVSCQYNTGIKCLPLLPDSLVYLDITKNIVCLPNVIKKATVDMYEGFVPTAVNLPICNSLKPPPCDTFPQIRPQDSTNIANKPVKITFFPNPTEGEVKIKCLNCAVKKATIFNAIGQLVREVQTTDVLDFSGLGCGMYIVRVETVNGDTVVVKIVRI